MTGNNPTDRSKLGTKRHILTDKKGIPLSAVISSASTHDIKLVTDVVDNTIIKRYYHPHHQQNVACLEKENYSTYVLIKRTVPRQQNRKSSAEDMCRIYRTREKEGRSRQKHKRCQIKKNILPLEDG